MESWVIYSSATESVVLGEQPQRPLLNQNPWGGAPAVQVFQRQSPPASTKGHFPQEAFLELQAYLSGWNCFVPPLSWHRTLYKRYP